MTHEVPVPIGLEFQLLEDSVGRRALGAFGEFARRTVVNQIRTGLIVAPGAVNLSRDPETVLVELALEVQEWVGQRLDIRYYPQSFRDGIFVGQTLGNEEKQAVEETYRHFVLNFQVVDAPPGNDDLIVGWNHRAEIYDIDPSEWTEENTTFEYLEGIDDFRAYQMYIPADQVRKLPTRLVDMIKDATAKGFTEQPEGYGIPEITREIVRTMAENKTRKPSLGK